MRYVFVTVALLMTQTVNASATSVGSTDLPLGEAAFATTATCQDNDGCGASITYLSAPPDLTILSVNSGLTAAHILDVVATDLFLDDVFRLQFSQPIRNEPGSDLYLAQAKFLGQTLMDAVGVNEFGLSFDNGSTWSTVPATDFAEDMTLGPETVWFGDPDAMSDAYTLWFAAIDLSDLGLAADLAIDRLDIRGVPRPGGRGTEGLDVVTVASLNRPMVAPIPLPATLPLLLSAVFALGAAVHFGRCT